MIMSHTKLADGQHLHDSLFRGKFRLNSCLLDDILMIIDETCTSPIFRTCPISYQVYARCVYIYISGIYYIKYIHELIQLYAFRCCIKVLVQSHCRFPASGSSEKWGDGAEWISVVVITFTTVLYNMKQYHLNNVYIYIFFNYIYIIYMGKLW